ncbi:MAG: hypothetical protein LC624_10145, partial [Halobacteriales archaeon]|nr:hypothetical protein [Halobacteriales archaeon]
TTTVPATYTWDASSSLGPVSMTFGGGPGKPAGRATISSLPPFVQVRAAPDVVEFDGRSSAGAPIGSGAVGTLSAAFTTDGQFLGAQNATDHVSLQQTGSATRVDVVTTGLQYAKADTRSHQQHLEVRSSAPRKVDFTVDLPSATFHGFVANVPSRVALDIVGTRFAYTGSAAIGEIAAGFDDKQGMTASLDVQGVPAALTVDLSTADQRGWVNVTASAPLPLVSAAFARASGGTTTTGQASVQNVPASLSVAYDAAAADKTLTLSAGSAFGPLGLSIASGPGKPAFSASVSSVPPFMRFTAGRDWAEFDARASPTAAKGSASVGTLLAAVATDGLFLTGQPAADHLGMAQTATSAIRAELRYTGLSYALADLRTGDPHIELWNSAPRLFLASLDTPAATIAATFDSVPARMSVDLGETVLRYNASAAIHQVAANLTDKGTGALLAVDVRDLPGTMALTLDPGTQHLAYVASAVVGSIGLDATVPTPATGTWTLGVDLVTIPTAWSLDFASGSFVYDSAVGIGSIGFYATNLPAAQRSTATCGLTGAPPVLAPNHLCATLDVPGKKFEADLLMVSLKHVEARRLATGELMAVDVGGGSRFAGTLNANVSSTDRATVAFDVNPLPRTMRLITGSSIDYTASDVFDLALDATYGHPDAFSVVPDPAVYALGIAVRDGHKSVGILDEQAVKAKVRLTGMPGSLRVTPAAGAFSVDAVGWRPKTTSLVLDADLHDVQPRVKALVTIDNFGTPGAAQDLHAAYGAAESITSYSEALCRDFRDCRTYVYQNSTSAHYSTLTTIGPVTATFITGDLQGRFEMSSVPRTMDVSLTETKVVRGSGIQTRIMPADGTALTYTAASAIARLYLGVAVNQAEQAATYDGALTLTDVPSSFTLSLGRNSVGPEVDYSASASTLDLSLDVAASLQGGDVRAKASAGFTNLGATTTTTVSGGELQMASSPDTDAFFVAVWAEASSASADSGSTRLDFAPGLYFKVGWSYDLTLDGEIRNLRTIVDHLRTLNIKPGFPTRVTGSYDSFFFGWDQLSATIGVDASGTVEACIDWTYQGTGLKGCSNPIVSVTKSSSVTLVPSLYFHLANDHSGTWLTAISASISTGCVGAFGHGVKASASVNGAVDMKPHSHGATRNGFTTYGTGSPLGEGNGKWYVLPDISVGLFTLTSPLIPSSLAPIVMYSLADSRSLSLDLGWSGPNGSFC